MNKGPSTDVLGDHTISEPVDGHGLPSYGVSNASEMIEVLTLGHTSCRMYGRRRPIHRRLRLCPTLVLPSAGAEPPPSDPASTGTSSTFSGIGLHSVSRYDGTQIQSARRTT